MVGPLLAGWELVARHSVQHVSAWSYVVLGGACNSLGRGDCLLIISLPGLRQRRALGGELCLEISLLTSLWNAGACGAYIVTCGETSLELPNSKSPGLSSIFQKFYTSNI